MDIPSFEVELVCLFCGSTLKGPVDAQYTSGDLIECHECHEHNDYDSVFEVAKEKGIEQVKEIAQEQLQNEFKDLFKKKL